MLYRENKLNNENINSFLKEVRKNGKIHIVTCCKNGNYFASYSGKRIDLQNKGN